MEQFKICTCVALATILLLSLSVNAQPLLSTEDNDTDIPPLIFPKENVIIGDGPVLYIFPTENVTIGDRSIPVLRKEDIIPKPVELPPLIFPTTNETGPIIELPSLIFPDDNNTSVNQTALDILNAASQIKHGNIIKLPIDTDVNYYAEDSSEESDLSDSVEEVQADDKRPQKDNLEENYKSEMNSLPRMPVSDYDDNTEVDHPILLKDTHILGIIGAVLAVLCVCLYTGITVWRRVMFNRYGMRERLINEDDFYSNDKSVRHNF